MSFLDDLASGVSDSLSSAADSMSTWLPDITGTTGQPKTPLVVAPGSSYLGSVAGTPVIASSSANTGEYILIGVIAVAAIAALAFALHKGKRRE